jgi:putative transposase
MPRHARLRIAGLPLHVVQRGTNRARCFNTPDDLSLYLGLLNQFGTPLGVDVHAYVLMPNHVHLLLSPREAWSISGFMKQVGQRYAQHFNRTYGRTGAFWEGRFHSSIVDTDKYLMLCHRYIELNPVRAGLCGSPHAYEWSSFGANALGRPSLVLAPHREYVALGADAVSRREAYLGLFEGGVSDEELRAIRRSITSGYALGSEAFVDQLEREIGCKARFGRATKERARGNGEQPALFE